MGGTLLSFLGQGAQMFLVLAIAPAIVGIVRIVNANMANATRKVLAGYGADARSMAMIAFGGNGPVHAWAIARELDMGRVLVPKTASACSWPTTSSTCCART